MNKIIKILSYVGTFILCFIQCFLTSLAVTGILMSLVCGVVSLSLHSLPVILNQYFWLTWLIVSTPVTVIPYIKIIKEVLKG